MKGTYKRSINGFKFSRDGVMKDRREIYLHNIKIVYL